MISEPKLGDVHASSQSLEGVRIMFWLGKVLREAVHGSI